MAIWKSSPSLEDLNRMNKNTIHSALGIQFTQITDTTLEATLPVDERTRQPAGLLHGGASVVLAESLGSVASLLVVGMEEVITGKLACVGIEVNANHLRSVRKGMVRGKVTPIHLGRTLHIWEIKISDTSDEAEVCRSRLTVMVKTL